jgi:PAS domain S-box-containing protein
MTEGGPEATVSRARFDRERRARNEAEALLEEKSRLLYAANQRLLRESEAMRAALAETEELRAREAAALQEQSILSRALTALSGKSGAAEAMQELLGTLQSAFGIFDACFVQEAGAEVRIAASAHPEHAGLILPLPSGLLSRARRLGRLLDAGSSGQPARIDEYASTLIAPLGMADEASGALLLGSLEPGRFSAKDLRLLERVAGLAAQSLTALREARRNALLVSLVEGRPIESEGGVLDAPLEAVHRAFARLTDLQGTVVGILDDLLGAPLDGIDPAIERALAALGEATGMDRVYVFRLREDAGLIDNTHEWCASGIAAMREELQGLPAGMIAHWREAFDAGRDVLIPDVGAMPDEAPEKEILESQDILSLLAVPMVQDGEFRGFVGYDAVRAKRTFLPGEIHLIRSVAKVIASLIARREQTVAIERLSEIARRTSNLVVMTDAERRITWVNEAFERTAGWRLDEIRGEDAGSILHGSETDRATVAVVRAALERAEPVQAEILNRARDGRLYWVDLDIQPLRDASGRLEGFVAVQTDVTESRERAEALRIAAEDAARARATLEAAVEALEDGFVLYDADDRLVICNERYREIYPRSAAAIVPGASFEEILRHGLAHGEYADAVGREEEWLAERLERHRAPDSEVEQRLSDGRWLRIFEKTTPDGGRVGLRVDITALKQAEQSARADLAAAMEASQDGVAITDAEGRFLYMNRAHLDLFGYESEAQVVGKPWSMLYEPGAAAWLDAHAMPELVFYGRWSGEIMGKARDGGPVDQEVSLTQKEDGGILWIVRDMQHRRRESAERDRLREELQLAQRREIVGQMAAGLAHDFNNLLATISGGALLIGEASEEGSIAAIGAQRIQSATGQAAALVKRLLSLGRREEEPKLLDLRAQLREAGDLVRAGLRAPTRLEMHLPDTPVEVVADPTDVLQTVLNLAINARDALDGGPGVITISLGHPDEDALGGPFAVGTPNPARRYCAITVADTGPGMTAEQVARAFRPYETTKGTQGSGLGLTIVSSVIARVGGALKLVTTPSEGSTFTILWPESPVQARAEALTEELTGRLDGRTVLLVDDQEDVLVILTAFLESVGAEVAPSSVPSDAIEALEDDPEGWDLLITDFDMPGTTGTELAQAARARAPGLPVVLVTALAGMAGRDSGIFDAVLGKPVDKGALVAAAEAAIVRAEQRGG